LVCYFVDAAGNLQDDPPLPRKGEREGHMRSRLAANEKHYMNRQRVCHVGSIAADGRPHAAPLSHAYDDGKRTLYIATERGGRTATNLRERPLAAVTFDEYSENWDRIRGIILQARAHKLERGTEFERARKKLAEKFRQYKTIEIDYVLALKVEGVTASWGL
jgi:nitroimidazol reductase NimA-like FMN-containing flavoprotein (pyridoxamine 5'-phosphate oxidase superfamily)